MRPLATSITATAAMRTIAPSSRRLADRPVLRPRRAACPARGRRRGGRCSRPRSSAPAPAAPGRSSGRPRSRRRPARRRARRGCASLRAPAWRAPIGAASRSVYSRYSAPDGWRSDSSGCSIASSDGGTIQRVSSTGSARPGLAGQRARRGARAPPAAALEAGTARAPRASAHTRRCALRAPATKWVGASPSARVACGRGRCSPECRSRDCCASPGAP